MLEMVIVKTVYSVEVVCGEEHDAGPFQVARSLHAKNYHEAGKFHQKKWLQD